MASYAKAFSFLVVIAFLIALKVESRESKYFSNFNPQVDEPSFKPSSEIKNPNVFNFHKANPQVDEPSFKPSSESKNPNVFNFHKADPQVFNFHKANPHVDEPSFKPSSEIKNPNVFNFHKADPQVFNFHKANPQVDEPSSKPSSEIKNPNVFNFHRAETADLDEPSSKLSSDVKNPNVFNFHKADPQVFNFHKANSRVDEPSSKPSSEIKNPNVFNFHKAETADLPTDEFIESIKKDSWKTNDFSRDFDQSSYYKENDGDDFAYPNKINPTEDMQGTDASPNNGFELSDEEKKFFNKKESTNGYTSFKNDDDENVDAKEAQEMSDTRTLKNGKYFYNPGVARANRGGVRSNTLYRNKEQKSNSDDFRPLKDFEYNPQNQVGFVP